MVPPHARSRIHEAALQLFAQRGTSEISVSELAQAAGVARGTIYNNVERPDQLFGEIASDLAHEMYARTVASMVGIDDPARRLSTGLRLFMRRAHDEPHWGRFIVRFSLTDSVLRTMMGEPPTVDIARGIESGRYKMEPAYLPAVVSLVSGAGLSAMLLVLDGHLTWRDAGSQIAELVLRALGVPTREARAIATSTLPPLSDVAEGDLNATKQKTPLKQRKAKAPA
jgi:AcrR family transcriptional regulator